MAGGSTPSRRFGSHGTAGFGGKRHTAKHVWVGTTPSPGVLIDWRKDGPTWLGFVAYVEAGRIIVAWLPSDLIRPAHEAD